MIRRLAIERLYWHHARERWDSFQINHLRRVVPHPFPRPYPMFGEGWLFPYSRLS